MSCIFGLMNLHGAFLRPVCHPELQLLVCF